MNFFEVIITTIASSQLVAIFLSIVLFYQTFMENIWQTVTHFSNTILLLKEWQNMAEDLQFFCGNFEVQKTENGIKLFQFPLFELYNSKMIFFSISDDPIWVEKNTLESQEIELKNCGPGQYLLILSSKNVQLIPDVDCHEDFRALFKKNSSVEVLIPVVKKEFKFSLKQNLSQVQVRKTGTFQVFVSGFESIHVSLLPMGKLQLILKIPYFSQFTWSESLC